MIIYKPIRMNVNNITVLDHHMIMPQKYVDWGPFSCPKWIIHLSMSMLSSYCAVRRKGVSNTICVGRFTMFYEGFHEEIVHSIAGMFSVWVTALWLFFKKLQFMPLFSVLQASCVSIPLADWSLCNLFQ